MPSQSYVRKDTAGTGKRIVTYQGVNPNTSVQIQSWSNLAHTSRLLTRSWTTTPSFVQKRRRGELLTNNYSYLSEKEVFPYGIRSDIVFSEQGKAQITDTYSGGGEGGPHGSFNYPVTFLSPSPQVIYQANAIAVTKLLDRIKNQKFNFAQFWAERDQTINLIASTARKIAASYSALRRGNIVDAGKVLTGIRPSRRIRRGFRVETDADRAAAQAWLEMQYGWVPLLSDIKGAVEALNDGIQSDLKLIRSSGKGSAKEFYTIESAGPNGSRATTKVETEYQVKYTSFHRIRAQATSMSTSLGLQNPLSLAWELVPYSFVVDWFLPIGEYLHSLDATAGLQFATGSKTTVVKQTVSTTWEWSDEVKWNPGQPAKHYYVGKVTRRKERVNIERRSESGFPSPQIPNPKNPVNSQHVLNAIALLTTAIRR